jgi:hypothetical protein
VAPLGRFGRPLLALGALVLAIAGVVAALQFFSSKDDATVTRSGGPGSARPAGDTPAVRDGNVLLLHRRPGDARALRALADDVAGPSSAKLQAAGQAVLVRRDPALAVPIIALTATRRIESQRADDPALVQFVEYWLGRRTASR